MKMILTKEELEFRANKIKYFFTDVDGTLTDGCTYYSARGEELKKFSHVDGTGFYLLRKAGLIAGIITGENSDTVMRRAEKLQVSYCFLGIKDKFAFMEQFAQDHGCTLDEIAYIGDDLNDLQLLINVGLAYAPINASNAIKSIVQFQGKKKGGKGAFREAVESLLELKQLNVSQLFLSKE